MPDREIISGIPIHGAMLQFRKVAYGAFSRHRGADPRDSKTYPGVSGEESGALHRKPHRRRLHGSLDVGHESGPKAADPADAANDFLSAVGKNFPEQGTVDQSGEDLASVVGHSVVGGEEKVEFLGGKGGVGRFFAPSSEGCSARSGSRNLFTNGLDAGNVVGNPLVGASGFVDMNLGAADVEAGEFLGFCSLDEGGTGDDHVGLLGHVDPIADDRHVATTRDAVAEHPRDLRHALGAQQAVHLIGLPEGRIPLSEATIYLASAPKSNSAYKAIDAALSEVTNSGDSEIPLHLRNAITDLMANEGYGKGYEYSHNYEGHFKRSENLPEGLSVNHFYDPGKLGYEKYIADRLSGWWGDRYIADSSEKFPS